MTEVKDRIMGMLAKAQQMHEKRYATDTDELAAMYFLYKGTDVHTVAVVMLTANPQERNAMVAAIGAQARKEGCDGYVYSSEGWTVPHDKLHTVRPGDSFAQSAYRQEILIVEAGTDQPGQSGTIVARMDRTTPGQVKLDWQEPLVEGEGKAKMMSRMNPFNPQIPDRRSVMNDYTMGGGKFNTAH